MREEGIKCERKISAGLGGIGGTEEEGRAFVEVGVGWNEERSVEISSEEREVESPERVAILNPDESVNNPALAALARIKTWVSEISSIGENVT